jgi:uroporphyrinogen-III synthase
MPRTPGHRLQGCHVVSLRPVGDHEALRRAAAREGAQLLALSPWRIEQRDDATTRDQLRKALQASHVVFTSPSAVRAALALQPLCARDGQRWCAVGAGTAAALRRAGIAHVESPRRMDSEGLLDLPALAHVRGAGVGLVTAPGGRDRIAAGLLRRGARILRADVYTRVPIAPSVAAQARLRAVRRRPWLALSSAQALHQILAQLPATARDRLLRARVAAASDRLAALAQEAGFEDIHLAASARPRDLIAAMAGTTS